MPQSETPPSVRTFGENLKEARVRANLTQEELADRLGFARASPISLWERPSAPVPEPKTIVKLADAIPGCTPADLLRGVVTPYDALRGAAVSAVNGGDVVLSPDDLAWLRLGRALTPALRRAYVRLMEAQTRARSVETRDERRATTRERRGAHDASSASRARR